MIPQAVLWCDPGEMTGTALLWEHGTKFRAWEWPFMEAGDYIEACAVLGPLITVGYETYTIRPGLPQDDAHHAIEMIGVIRRAAIRNGCTLVSASPRERLTVTMAELEAIGIWPAGQDDAQSATQHLAAWLRRTHQTPAAWRSRLSVQPGTL